MNKLSHSACSRFQMCGMSYKYHYIDRIRPQVFSAALIFGSALDEALNALLLGNADPHDKFDEHLTKSWVNNELTSISHNPNLVYAESDFDVEIVKETIDISEYNKLKEEKKKRGWLNMPEEDRSRFNYLNWLSLKSKGHLMIEAYKEKILPRITKVHAVQREVQLKNEHGDSIVGYVDLIADIKDIGTIIIDHKTSASEYAEDAVLTSPQLALYTHILEDEYKTKKAGYIVLRKNILKNRKKICSACGHDGSGKQHKTCNNDLNGKRCGGTWNETIDPDVNIQVIIDEIPTQTEQIVIENYDEINRAIKAQHFSRNFNSCNSWYGGDCPYKSLCYKATMKGLIHVKKENV